MGIVFVGVSEKRSEEIIAECARTQKAMVTCGTDPAIALTSTLMLQQSLVAEARKLGTTWRQFFDKAMPEFIVKLEEFVKTGVFPPLAPTDLGYSLRWYLKPVTVWRGKGDKRKQVTTNCLLGRIKASKSKKKTKLERRIALQNALEALEAGVILHAKDFPDTSKPS